MLAAAEGSQAPLVLALLWPLQGCRDASGLQGTSPSLVTSILFRPLVSDSHLFVVSPEEYTIWCFWEMTFDSGYTVVVRL